MAYDPILPHGLVQTRKEGERDFSNSIFGNNTIKMGVVLEILEEDDELNVLKLGPEYHVMAIEQDKKNGSNTAIYKNCMALDSFGGVGDFFEQKYRVPADMKKVKDSGSVQDQNGSIVLLLCLDGNAEKAVIIGSIAHPGRKTTLTKEAGHHMEGEFNGVNWKVNKDGELLVTFKSATDSEGSPRNAAAGGTYISIDKTGSFEVNDGVSSQIKMDKSTQEMTIKSGLDIKESAVGNIEMSSGGNTTVSASNWAVNVAAGSANLACLDWEVEALGPATLSSLTMEIKAKAMLTTEAPYNVIKGNIVSIEGSITLVGGAGALPAIILPTQFLGTGNLGAPVVSNAIGPFSSSVLVK